MLISENCISNRLLSKNNTNLTTNNLLKQRNWISNETKLTTPKKTIFLKE